MRDDNGFVSFPAFIRIKRLLACSCPIMHMCLCSACKIICDIFKHSQVFRVGGDEFAVISQNDDYDRIEELIETVKSHNASAIRTGGIVIACGTAKYENDSFVASVFERADRQMYENKDHLKTLTHPET